MVTGSGNKVWTQKEINKIKKMKTPQGIQDFLYSIPYHVADTAWSPRRVLGENRAHCLEGAIFAASALRILGYPPLILDMEADRDTDHVIAVYRIRGYWGAIAKSNYTGCFGRDPVYRTLREMMLSYVPVYFNGRRERTLRRYSRPVNLRRFDSLNWETTQEPVWFIAEHLVYIPHSPLFDAKQERYLSRVDDRTYRAGILGKQVS
jgi:hypothetical protein